MQETLRAIRQAGDAELVLQLIHAPESSLLRCFRVLRCLPGKRLACMADWQGRTVFAKLFFDRKRAKRHWQREERGIRSLIERDLLTPSLIYSGRLNDETVYVLLFEYIPGGHSFLSTLEAKSGVDRRDVLLDLAAILADHHNKGVVQKDLHLDNFLCVDSRIYTLDGANIVTGAKPLRPKPARQNLALLFAQLRPDDEQWFNAVYTRYSDARDGIETAGWRERTHSYIAQQRRLRQRHFFKRIFRECRDFGCRRSWRTFMVFDKAYASPSLHALLQDPDPYMTDGEALKRGNTATVARVAIDSRALVIKRYNMKNWRHAVKRALRPSRAAVSWRNAHRLGFYGIATPKPVALIEQRFGPLRRKAYFVTEHVAAMDCRTYFFSTKANDTLIELVARKVTEQLIKLHRHRICHGDLKATNLLIADRQAFLIDLDAMKEHRFRFRFRHCWRRDMHRFFKNWQTNQTVNRLFTRLLKAYC